MGEQAVGVIGLGPVGTILGAYLVRSGMTVYGVDTLQERVDRTPEREQELSALTRDYNNLTDTYRTLLSKKYEAAIARNLEAAQKGERFKLKRGPAPAAAA